MHINVMKSLIVCFVVLLSISACSGKAPDPSLKGKEVVSEIEQEPAKETVGQPTLPVTDFSTPNPRLEVVKSAQQVKTELIRKYQNQDPTQWGENVSGVKRKMKTADKVVALTFDACGGDGGNGYDKKLIDYLMTEQIPATLFVNSRWIDDNKSVFMELAANPLFEIENHGYLHKPLSVNGKSAWKITGTQDVGEVVDEVLLNQMKIEQLTGRKPLLFRSGTAYYDNVATQIANELGVIPVNFDVLGDAGATFNAAQIKQAFVTAVPGSIIISHMNHPEKETAKGVMLGVPELRKKGFQFVRLDAYTLE